MEIYLNLENPFAVSDSNTFLFNLKSRKHLKNLLLSVQFWSRYRTFLVPRATIITKSERVTFLGVYIDCNLAFQQHFKKIAL